MSSPTEKSETIRPASVLFNSNPALSDIAWSKVKKKMPWLVVFMVLAAGLVGIVGVMTGGFGLITVQLLFTIGLIIVISFLSLYDAEVSSRRSSLFALISVVVNLYIAVLGFLKLWLPGWAPLNDDWWALATSFWDWIIIAVIARIALLHANLLLAQVIKFRTPLVEVIAKIAVFLILALGLLLSFPVITSGSGIEYSEMYWRVVASVAILDVLATLLIPLIHRLFNRDEIKAQQRSQVRADYGQKLAPPRGSVKFDNIEGAPLNGLKWPVMANGNFLPVNLDSTPDFAMVARDPVGNLIFVPVGQQTNLPNALQWPVMIDGQPLPAISENQPDFTGVARW